jgi:hypothetical protein
MSLPKDFYWREYIALNKDLYHINIKEDAIKHYINHGVMEERQYKITKNNCLHLLPQDFDWKEYYLLKNDPNIKKNKRDVFFHYLVYGRNKTYKLIKDKNKRDNITHNDDDDLKNSSKNNGNVIDSYIKYKKKYEIVGNYDKYHENEFTQEKINYSEDNYDFLDETDIIRTKVTNERYLEFESDINLLDILPKFILIIDSNNMESKDCFFINSIVSKYKTHCTFLILRYDQNIFCTLSDSII